jgi:hypothetical protein
MCYDIQRLGAGLLDLWMLDTGVSFELRLGVQLFSADITDITRVDRPVVFFQVLPTIENSITFFALILILSHTFSLMFCRLHDPIPLKET